MLAWDFFSFLYIYSFFLILWVFPHTYVYVPHACMSGACEGKRGHKMLKNWISAKFSGDWQLSTQQFWVATCSAQCSSHLNISNLVFISSSLPFMSSKVVRVGEPLINRSALMLLHSSISAEKSLLRVLTPVLSTLIPWVLLKISSVLPQLS